MKDTTGVSAHLNVNCLETMLAKPRMSYEWLRFDSNDDCNLHCVYCHNSRSKAVLDPSVFQHFLLNNAERIDNFQFGCRMEPTLDRRLLEFMQILHASPARPQKSVALQTNAILLHKHDGQKMVEAGLTDLQVSIDTIDETVFAELRGGAKIGKILRNLRSFSKTCPQVAIKFIVTVSKSNLPQVEDLIAFGVEMGIKSAVVREMFHIPGKPHVDDEKMSKLVLQQGEFADLAQRLKKRFTGQLYLNCIDANGVLSFNSRVQAISY